MVPSFQVEVYRTRNGTHPFVTWLDGFKDRASANRIRARVANVSAGHLGDYRALGDGLYELRIFSGPGYRLYFARDRERVILLLCGGGKGSQGRDVVRARRYLQDYRERRHGSDDPLG
jgi:putative addiction module killer protein